MKKDKIIDLENNDVISDFKILSSLNSKNSHPLVVDETDETYRIVKEFSESAQATSEILAAVEAEVPEEEKEIIYAEEIISDDDDLYGDETKDREIEKQKHRSYAEIAKELDEKLEENGYHSTVGFNLLAAMKFSRFLFFKYRETLNDEIKALIRTLDFPYHNVKVGLENIAEDEGILDVLANAKKSLFKPYFVFVGEVEPENVFEYFRPVYNFIDNPDGDSFMFANGRNVYIPHNIFFIYTIKDFNKYFDIPRRLLRYSAIVDGELIPVEAKSNAECNKMILSFDQLNVAFLEADAQYSISEDAWRKIDNFALALNQVNNYKLHNKIVRRLENYMILGLSCDKKEADVVDACLAYNLMSEAIISKFPVKYFTDFSLPEMLDDCFDQYPMSKCREVVNNYLSLFDKKGERKIDE